MVHSGERTSVKEKAGPDLFLDQDDLVEYIYVLRQDEPKPVKYPKLPGYIQDRDKDKTPAK